MFNEEELNFIGSICTQLSFKPGQAVEYLLNENILQKIKGTREPKKDDVKVDVFNKKKKA